MNIKFFILHLFVFGTIYSQTNISYFKDIGGSYDFETIKTADFKEFKTTISDGYNKATYWFKVGNLNTESKYFFRIKNEHIHEVSAFQNNAVLAVLSNERYPTISFKANNELFVKVTPRKESYFPLEIAEESRFMLKEKMQIILIGIYFGFSFLIIVLNVFYFFVFSDSAFIYYAFFLFSISLSLFISDGMLNVFALSERTIDFSIITACTLVAFFSFKFANSYLQLAMYYPKLKFLAYGVLVLILISDAVFLATGNFTYLILINFLVFSLLLVYWLAAIGLFKKNRFIKLYTFAYAVILFQSATYYIFKVLGIPSGNLSATHIKLGGFIEMVVLALAVIYRMRILKEENEFMRSKILFYSKELEKVSEAAFNKEKDEGLKHESLLSIRENEIFLLIVGAHSNMEIADKLNISVNTVKFHIKNMYEKLHVKSRKEVLSIAINRTT